MYSIISPPARESLWLSQPAADGDALQAVAVHAVEGARPADRVWSSEAGRSDLRQEPRLTQHGATDDLRQELVELARSSGLLTVQAPKRFGGRKLRRDTRAFRLNDGPTEVHKLAIARQLMGKGSALSD